MLLFTGVEDHLKQEALSALRKALLPPGLEDLNETLLENPETDALIAAAETIPFMADRRLVVIRDYPPLVGRAEADARLLEYLPQVPPTALLLFYCVQPAVKTKKIVKAVQKLNGLVEFEALKGAALTSFVTDAFRAQGRECDARTAEFLIFTCGSDTNLLLTEIAKIAAYRTDTPAVHPDDVKALATPSAESNVFQMVDAVVSGQDARALRLLRDTLLDGDDPVRLLGLLLRQFRLMQHVKIMQYEKRSPADMQSLMGLSPYAFQQYLRQASLWSPRQIRDAVRLCLDTDLGIKSGRLPQKGTLETVILKLFLSRKPD
ncbi:MAG: DNA polymerase III subunit delta [Clostridia bacterium]|nr:DNA polymerase III subunit delta [Clostridia bacterium]